MSVVLAFLSAALGVAGLALLLPRGTGQRAESRRIALLLPRRMGERATSRRIAPLLPRRTGERAASARRIVGTLAALGRHLPLAWPPASGERAGVPGKAPHGSLPGGLHARIAAAGAPAGLSPRELMGAKLAAAIAAAAGGLPLAAAAPGRLGVCVAIAAPLVGFHAPDLWLRRLAAARGRRARRDLPALLDLLRVSVEAGLSLPAALRAVGGQAAGPLASEWRSIGRQTALGVPLTQALGAMAERLPIAEVRALVAALERAGRHGAPLSDTLAAQARDARFALGRRVREEAARAGPKIQLVVALLLVPSVLLLVAAGLASALLEPGGAMFVPT